MTTKPIEASTGRLPFALYIDFLLFMVIWGSINYVLGSGELRWGVGVVAFVVVRLISWKLGSSPGMHMLSISRSRAVDRGLFYRENWLTMFLGGLFVLEGAKLLVNWTSAVVPEPFFGFVPEQSTQVTIDLLSGILLILAGYLYLKLKWQGFLIALLAAFAGLASCIASWSLFSQTVPGMVIAGRAVQGRVASAGEITFMQTPIPLGSVALYTVVVIAIICSYRPFRVQALVDNSSSE